MLRYWFWMPNWKGKGRRLLDFFYFNSVDRIFVLFNSVDKKFKKFNLRKNDMEITNIIFKICQNNLLSRKRGHVVKWKKKIFFIISIRKKLLSKKNKHLVNWNNSKKYSKNFNSKCFDLVYNNKYQSLKSISFKIS